MLTVSSLDDGSSMGTAPAQASGDESSLMGDNDNWGVVTQGDSGVLILEGEEPDAPALLSEGENGLQLSLPGTDSVPTIVGSIEALMPPESVDDTRSNDSGEGNATKEATPPSDFEEKSSNEATDTSWMPPTFHFTIYAMTFLLVLLCLAAAALISHREENQQLRKKDELNGYRILFLQKDLFDLEQENKRLSSFEEEVEHLKQENVRMISLEQQVDHLTKEIERLVPLELQVQNLKEENERMKREEALRWETCRKQEDGTVLMDNCWITATADVRLGECVKDVKDAFADLSTSFFEQLRNASAAFGAAQETSVDDIEATVAKIINKVDSLGKDFGNKMDSLGKGFWKGSDWKNTEGDTFNGFMSKMDEIGKSWFKDSVLGLFSQDQEETVSSKADEQAPDKMDEGIKGLSEMMTAGQTLMTMALDKAAETMGINQTELLDAAMQALDDASVAQHFSSMK